MANKRLKIENLDNLQELDPEEVFSIQGGGAELKAIKPYGELERLIPVDSDNPKSYPLPVWPPYPYPCKPYYPNYPIKDIDKDGTDIGKDGTVLLHWCPTIL